MVGRRTYRLQDDRYDAQVRLVDSMNEKECKSLTTDWARRRGQGQGEGRGCHGCEFDPEMSGLTPPRTAPFDFDFFMTETRSRMRNRGSERGERAMMKQAQSPEPYSAKREAARTGRERERRVKGDGGRAVKGFGLVRLQVLKIQGDYIVSRILHVLTQRGWETITYPCELTNKCLGWYTAHTC